MDATLTQAQTGDSNCLQGMLPGHASPVEDDDLVSQLKGFFLVMRDKDAGYTNLINYAFEPLPH